MDMDMKKLEFLDIYPDPISGSEKGYISISYIQHLDIYPGYISNRYIYPTHSCKKVSLLFSSACGHKKQISVSGAATWTENKAARLKEKAKRPVFYNWWIFPWNK